MSLALFLVLFWPQFSCFLIQKIFKYPGSPEENRIAGPGHNNISFHRRFQFCDIFSILPSSYPFIQREMAIFGKIPEKK